VAVQEKSALLKKAQEPTPTIAAVAHKDVHIHILPDDDKTAAVTDRRGLIASFVILLLSIPALIGA